MNTQKNSKKRNAIPEDLQRLIEEDRDVQREPDAGSGCENCPCACGRAAQRNERRNRLKTGACTGCGAAQN